VPRAEYTARPHVIVSYSGDLRGIVEDANAVRRRVVCSVARFSSLGELLPGTDLVATVPDHIAARLLARHRALRMAPLPFALPCFPQEMRWNRDDDALRWLRGCVRDARGHLDIAPRRGEA
jgi:LysR family transcriptional regulator, mexEF-oprN operon transcriptional activator